MIKSVEIHNFLSHRHSVIDLHKETNIFVGASDSGKSAFVKALKWCIWNRPLGDDFYSWPEVRDGEGMWVKVTTDNHVITRKKGKQEEYILDELSFKSFGINVPEEIIKAFNISELNWQNQLDSHFLLNLSPGDASSYFNKIAKLEKIDKGTNAVNSAIRELTADIKYKSAEEVKLIEDLKTYEHIDIFEYDVENLEKLEKEKAVLGNSIHKLHSVTSSYRLVTAKIDEQSKILELEYSLNNILDLIDQKKHAEACFDKLYGIEADILRCEEGIKHINETLTLENPVLELLGLYKNKQIVFEDKNRLFKTLSDIGGIQDRITNGNAFLEAKNKEWDEYMSVGSVCPLCNQKIS